MPKAPTKPLSPVGGYLTDRLVQLQMSHRDLAKAIAFAPSEVHRWVSGLRVPSVTAIHWLATVFSQGVPEAYGPIAAELVRRVVQQTGAIKKVRSRRSTQP